MVKMIQVKELVLDVRLQLTFDFKPEDSLPECPTPKDQQPLQHLAKSRPRRHKNYATTRNVAKVSKAWENDKIGFGKSSPPVLPRSASGLCMR